jgi:hypothetical protein
MGPREIGGFRVQCSASNASDPNHISCPLDVMRLEDFFDATAVSLVGGCQHAREQSTVRNSALGQVSIGPDRYHSYTLWINQSKAAIGHDAWNEDALQSWLRNANFKLNDVIASPVRRENIFRPVNTDAQPWFCPNSAQLQKALQRNPRRWNQGSL